MRLLHFTASKVWRGHEQKIIYLYESFQEKKYLEEQWIMCPIDSALCKVALKKGLNVIPYDFKSTIDFKLIKRFKNIVSEYQADLILIHSSQAHTIAIISAVFYSLKIPMIFFRTLIKKVNSNFLSGFKYNYSSIKKIICISNAVCETLKPAIKKQNRLIVLGEMLDMAKFPKKEKNGLLCKEFNIPPEYKLVGNISAFVAVKDHITWVNTVEILVKKGIKAKYVLIGIGPLEDEIKKLVNNKGLQDDIIFAGFRDDIPLIFPELDLFLFTSKNESTGSVILEAYACNVSIVAANAGGVPELLIDGETGFLAEAGNANDFAQKAEILLKEEQMRNKVVKNGYLFLTKTFDSEVVCKKMFNVLNEVYCESKK